MALGAEPTEILERASAQLGDRSSRPLHNVSLIDTHGDPIA